MCMLISIFGNNFSTVQNLGWMKNMKVAREGPMYNKTYLAPLNAVGTGHACPCMHAQHINSSGQSLIQSSRLLTDRQSANTVE